MYFISYETGFQDSIHHRFQLPSLYCMSSYRANTDFSQEVLSQTGLSIARVPSFVILLERQLKQTSKEVSYCEYWTCDLLYIFLSFSILRLYILDLLYF